MKYDLIDFLNAPFKMGGRDLKTGIDCYGIVIEAMKRFRGVNVPDVYRYNEKNSDNCFAFEVRRVALDLSLWKEVLFAKDADIVVFHTNEKPDHVGFVLNRNEFLHIVVNGTARVDKLTSLYWKNKIFGFYKWSV